MTGFLQMFDVSGEGEPPEEPEQPAWIGPADDELGDPREVFRTG
jgi:hypothetical protein